MDDLNRLNGNRWNNLWPHQRAASNHIFKYLDAYDGGGACLIRMPTGTGKSGIIAALARHIAGPHNVLVLTPWRYLVDQIQSDVDERFWERANVPTPAAKTSLRLYPKTSRAAIQALTDSPTIIFSTIASLNQIRREQPGDFSDLKRLVSVVVVDEGHYEPAESWSQSIRELDCPTVLFTATPYRNDFKFFTIDKTRVHVFSHAAATADRYLREPEFEPLDSTSEEGHCEHLVQWYADRVGAPSMDFKVIVRCASQSGVQRVTELLNRGGLPALGIHERFKASDRQQSLVNRVPNADGDNEHVVWVHQNKLIEGIDDPRFRALMVVDGFGNERALVQQIGRILRNPSQEHDAKSWVLHPRSQSLAASWDAYLSYDRQARDASGIGFSPRELAEKAVIAHYAEGKFRKAIDLDQLDPETDLAFPRTAQVFSTDASPDSLRSKIQKALKDNDCEWIGPLEPDDRSLLYPYVKSSWSPLLARGAFPEFEFGIVVVRRSGAYLFVTDTLQGANKAFQDIKKVEPLALAQMFPASEDGRITQASLSNIDISRNAGRRRSIAAFSLSEIAPQLNDHTHAPTVVVGTFDDADPSIEEATNRYVGMSRARVADRSRRAKSFTDYARWIDGVAGMLDADAETTDVLTRFAQQMINPPSDPSPVHVLIDAESELFETAGGDQLAIEDLSAPVTDGRFAVVANGEQYECQIDWSDDRYLLSSAALDQAYSMTEDAARDHERRSLLKHINFEQALRVMPASYAEDRCIFNHGQFYRPKLPLWGRRDRFPLEDLLHTSALLGSAISEKGSAGSATADGWDPASVFGIIDDGLLDCAGVNEIAEQFEYLVCTDLNNEIADFIALDRNAKRVVFMHAKASRTPAFTSAGQLHEVSSQAIKNLAFLQPYTARKPDNVPSWNQRWNDGRTGQVDRRIRKAPTGATATAIWGEFERALRDPQTRREVWLVLGASLSRSRLVDAFEPRRTPTAPQVQLLFSLQGTWSTVASIGAAMRVLCSP